MDSPLNRWTPIACMAPYHRVGRLYVGKAPTRPLTLNKSNGSELPNADVLSLFGQTTCSASQLLYTLILSKHVKYTATVNLRNL